MADDTTSNENVSEGAPTSEPAVRSPNLDETDPGEPTMPTSGSPAATAPAPTDHGDRVVPEPASSGPRRVIAVPVWLAALVAIFVVGGLGFAVGWFAAPGDSDVRGINARSSEPDRVPRTLPNIP